MESEAQSKFHIKDYLNWPLLGIILAWGVLITQVRHHWGGESYYNFGMFVPFLAIWLWLRSCSDLQDVSGEKKKDGSLPLVIGALAVLFILPFHAVSEVNPFWRLPLWIQATGLVLFSGAALYTLYGWNGVRKSIFPFFFLCMMIPWPWRIELAVVQTLTHYVVTVAMWGLHFIGYPVELQGNAMALGELSIGVNEACSGIRSLQALTMVTLFLGSLFGQGVWRRVAALLILPFIVLVINSLRAMFLATQVIVNGQEAYENWHDPAGYIAFSISMVLIYACIELLNVGSRRSDTPLGISLPQSSRLLKVVNLPRRYILYPLLPLVAFLVVEGWFQYKESMQVDSPQWTFNLPDGTNPNILYKEIYPTIEAALGYDYGHNFLFKKGGTVGEVYYYGYLEENKLSSVSSYGHKPTICMEGTGSTLREQFPDLIVDKDGLSLYFHHYLFELTQGGNFVHVFWVVWEKRNMNMDPDRLTDLDYKAQWIQLLHGRRDFSRKVVLVGLHTNASESDAKSKAQSLLTEWINPSGQ